MFKKSFFFSLILISALFLTGCSLKTTPIVESNNKITYPCIKNKTAFDSLTANNNTVEFQESSYGKMITSINNVPQGNSKYWQYSINDQYAEVGADAYKCLGGEIITWELK